MKVLVIGATGGSGRAAVAELLSRGHEVTAFSRHASDLDATENLRTVDGDATDVQAIDNAVAGHDAVVITLGISENPVRVRLRGPARTAADVRSRGTRNVVDAMHRHGVKRLVVQSTFGVGETAAKLRMIDRIFFGLLIKPQVADHAMQESIARASGLDFVIVQPVHLSDQPDEPERGRVSRIPRAARTGASGPSRSRDLPGKTPVGPFPMRQLPGKSRDLGSEKHALVSATGEVGQFKVSRKSVARVLADAVESRDHLGMSIAVSTPRAARPNG